MLKIIPFKQIEDEFFLKTKNDNFFIVVEIFGTNVDLFSEQKTEFSFLILANLFKRIETKITFIKQDFPLSLKKNTEFLKSIENPNNSAQIEKYYEFNKDIENQNLTYTRYFLVLCSEKRDDLIQTWSFVESDLIQLGFYPTLLKNEELDEFLSFLLFPKKLENNSSIYPDKMMFKPNYFITRKQNKNLFSSIYQISKFPLKVNAFWLEEMFNLPNTTVSFQITTPSKDRVLKTLNEFIEELKGKTLKYQKAKEESDVFQQLETLQELVEYVVSDQEQLKEIAVYFKFTAPTKRLLKETELKLLQTAKSRGFQIIKKSLVQQDCFTNFLPSMKTIKTNQIIQTSSLAAFFPFSYHNFLDEKGFFLGGVADGLFVFDLFKRNNYRANSNMFIVGASGQGKSFTTKKIMSQCRLKGAKVVIIDPEREYKIFTQNFGGNWVDVGAGTHGMINPLQIFLSDGKNDLTAHYQFLTAFFQLVLKNLDQKQLAILIDIIKQLYLKWKTNQYSKVFPTLSDLIEFIKQIENKTADIKLLVVYLDFLRNIAGKLWDGQTTIDTSSQIVCYDLYTLQQSGNTEIINAQLFLMLKYLENEVRLHKDNNNINPFTIAVDEAHLLIDRKNPIALNFMFQMTKRIRKYNGNLIVITQNINDFVGDETIKKYSTGIINNCQYAMIFRLNPGDLGDLKTLFSNNPLSDAEINEIAIMPRGNCLFAVTSNQKFNLKITAFDKEREQFELLEEQKTTKH